MNVSQPLLVDWLSGITTSMSHDTSLVCDMVTNHIYYEINKVWIK